MLQSVYNLTVADAPEFFANGVLVHNCDSMRYARAHFATWPQVEALEETGRSGRRYRS